jgi:hypothetical protein
MMVLVPGLLPETRIDGYFSVFLDFPHALQAAPLPLT